MRELQWRNERGGRGRTRGDEVEVSLPETENYRRERCQTPEGMRKLGQEDPIGSGQVALSEQRSRLAEPWGRSPYVELGDYPFRRGRGVGDSDIYYLQITSSIVFIL